MAKRISTTFYLEDDQIRDIRALSQATEVTQASMIREAIQNYLDSRRSEIPRAGKDPRQMDIPGVR